MAWDKNEKKIILTFLKFIVQEIKKLLMYSPLFTEFYISDISFLDSIIQTLYPGNIKILMLKFSLYLYYTSWMCARDEHIYYVSLLFFESQDLQSPSNHVLVIYFFVLVIYLFVLVIFYSKAPACI